MCSCLTQFVSQFLPGKELMSNYVCSGSFDHSLIDAPAKINYFSRYIFIFSAIWSIFAGIRIYR
jgi:hypothetical protein